MKILNPLRHYCTQSLIPVNSTRFKTRTKTQHRTNVMDINRVDTAHSTSIICGINQLNCEMSIVQCHWNEINFCFLKLLFPYIDNVDRVRLRWPKSDNIKQTSFIDGPEKKCNERWKFKKISPGEAQSVVAWVYVNAAQYEKQFAPWYTLCLRWIIGLASVCPNKPYSASK